VVNIAFILIMIYAAYLTNSRGGFLSLMIVFFFFFWQKFVRKKRFMLKILAFSVIAITLVVGMKLGPSRMSELDSSEESAHERSWLWETAYYDLKSSPIYGIGKGQFRCGIHSAAHNNFAQNMAEMGLVGLFLYVGLIYMSIKGTVLVCRSISRPGATPMLVNLSNAMFLCMIGFNAATFFITVDLDILFAWIGICACIINIARKEIEGFSFKLTFKDMAMIGLFSIGMIFLLYLISIKEIF